jgi:cell division septal protein FtsQ
MKTRLPFFALIFFSAAILAYAAARFMIGGKPAARIRIYSNGTAVGDETRTFLIQNANNLQKIPTDMLQLFPDVEHVSLRDNQNGVIDAWIKYKKIVGVWQNRDAFYPLLENGAHIPTAFGARPNNGPMFRGALPKDITEIIRVISAHPDVARRLDYLEYIEGRRWNLKLANGATIMLPEQNIQSAMDRMKTLGILDRSFDTLDLRDAKRPLVIPGQKSGAGKN